MRERMSDKDFLKCRIEYLKRANEALQGDNKFCFDQRWVNNYDIKCMEEKLAILEKNEPQEKQNNMEVLTAKIELLPCPFCGGTKIATHNEFNKMFIIQCVRCKAQSAFCKSESEAIERWNQRAEHFSFEVKMQNGRTLKKTYEKTHPKGGKK